MCVLRSHVSVYMCAKLRSSSVACGLELCGLELRGIWIVSCIFWCEVALQLRVSLLHCIYVYARAVALTRPRGMLFVNQLHLVCTFE